MSVNMITFMRTSNYYRLKLFKRLHGLNCIIHAVQVPRESLLFLINSFGGQASWDGNGAPFKESDEDITHQVIKNFENLLLLFNFCTFFDCKKKMLFIFVSRLLTDLLRVTCFYQGSISSHNGCMTV